MVQCTEPRSKYFMWTYFYFEIFSSASHPSPFVSDQQSLVEQIPKIEHSASSSGSPANVLVDKPLHQESLQKIKGVKPPYLLGSSLAGTPQESLLDLVSGGSDGGMNLTCVDHLQDPERQSDWFA